MSDLRLEPDRVVHECSDVLCPDVVRGTCIAATTQRGRQKAREMDALDGWKSFAQKSPVWPNEVASTKPYFVGSSRTTLNAVFESQTWCFTWSGTMSVRRTSTRYNLTMRHDGYLPPSGCGRRTSRVRRASSCTRRRQSSGGPGR